MNLIKNNPFVSALTGMTILVCAALFYYGSKGSGKYAGEKISFDESFASVSASESIPLYPTASSRDGKSKALGEYRQSIGELRGLFDKYRPAPRENVDPQDFTNLLKKANTETTAAFNSAGTTIPDDFFLGFGEYSRKLAIKDATGILAYQLGAISHALLGLADARPEELIRIYREPVPEETGGTFTQEPGGVARNFACEITFRGSEASARKFMSHLGKTDSHYHVIRCLKILNERDTPPKVGDAKFEPAKPANSSAAADIFNDVFNLPGAEGSPVVASPEGNAEAAAETAPPAPEIDSTRILTQVLGNENIVVFVRFDTSMLLPSGEIPNP